MGKYYIRIIICLSILSSISCTSSKSIRIPDPKNYELKGNRFCIILKSEEVFRTEALKVENDTVYFREIAIHINNVKAIETRSFSLVKTLGLTAGVGGAILVVGLSYLYFLFAYGRASEK
jgi:hypothetical protein